MFLYFVEKEVGQFTEHSENLTHLCHRLFGFLMGTVLAGGGLYYYVVDEYKVSNELLVEDIYVCGVLERGLLRAN